MLSLNATIAEAYPELYKGLKILIFEKDNDSFEVTASYTGLDFKSTLPHIPISSGTFLTLEKTCSTRSINDVDTEFRISFASGSFCSTSISRKQTIRSRIMRNTVTARSPAVRA